MDTRRKRLLDAFNSAGFMRILEAAQETVKDVNEKMEIQPGQNTGPDRLADFVKILEKSLNDVMNKVKDADETGIGEERAAEITSADLHEVCLNMREAVNILHEGLSIAEVFGKNHPAAVKLSSFKDAMLKGMSSCGIGYIEPHVGDDFNMDIHHAYALMTPYAGDVSQEELTAAYMDAYERGEVNMTISQVLKLGFSDHGTVIDSPQVVIIPTEPKEQQP